MAFVKSGKKQTHTKLLHFGSGIKPILNPPLASTNLVSSHTAISTQKPSNVRIPTSSAALRRWMPEVVHPVIAREDESHRTDNRQTPWTYRSHICTDLHEPWCQLVPFLHGLAGQTLVLLDHACMHDQTVSYGSVAVAFRHAASSGLLTCGEA
jgi:hypothetical protein